MLGYILPGPCGVFTSRYPVICSFDVNALLPSGWRLTMTPYGICNTRLDSWSYHILALIILLWFLQLSVDLTIEGDTAEAIRESSAKSRASLRSLHKDQLVAMRSALSERRSRSSTMTSPHSFRSVLSDAKLDEDGDMPFPEDTPGKRGPSPYKDRLWGYRDFYYKDKTVVRQSYLYDRIPTLVRRHLPPGLIWMLRPFFPVLGFTS